MKDFRTLLVEHEVSKRERELIMARAGLLPELAKFASERRLFARLQAGRFKVSVQASAFHYCEPRETFTDLGMYVGWEVYCGPQGRELLDLIGGPDKLVDASIVEYFGADDDQPASRVPTAVVQKYLDALEALGDT